MNQREDDNYENPPLNFVECCILGFALVSLAVAVAYAILEKI